MDNIPTFISNYYSLSTDKREEEELYKILNEFKGKEELILKEGKRELFLKNCSLPAETIYDIAKNIGQIKQYDGQPRAIKSPTEKQILQRFNGSASVQIGRRDYVFFNWLRNTTYGSTFIPLDFQPTKNTAAEYKVVYNKPSDRTNGHILSSSAWYAPFHRKFYGNDILSYRLGQERNMYNQEVEVGKEYVFKAYFNDDIYLNDVLISSNSTSGNLTSSGLFTIFTYAGMDTWGSDKTIYYIKLYEGGILKHSLVPAYRTEDEKYGFYDKITLTFYPANTNSGLTGG